MVNYAGSAQSYAKSLSMQWKAKMKWNEASGKKKSPFASEALPFAMGLKISSNSVQSMSGINTQEVDYRLSQIVMKLKRGKKLSSGEMDYLSQKDPSLYQKALRIEQEREEYERELRKCRTKEDVRRVGAIKNQLLIGEVKKAEAANDLSAATDIEMRYNAIKDAHETFINSRAYERLPEDYRELNDRYGKKERKGEKASAHGAAKPEKKQEQEPLAEDAKCIGEEQDDKSETDETSHKVPEIDNETDEVLLGATDLADGDTENDMYKLQEATAQKRKPGKRRSF